MSISMRTLFRSVVVVALLVLVAGCEDPDARSAASTAKSKATELEARVAKLESDLKNLQTAVDSTRGSLQNKINEDMEKVQNRVRQVEEDLTKKLDGKSDDLSKDLRDQLESVRRDFDGRLKNKIEVDVAESFQNVRKEIEKARTELLGFMDNQLKELYPYAYQPKRMDPNAAPEKPQE